MVAQQAPLFAALSRNYAILQVALRELFERTGRELLLTHCGTIPRKLVEDARVPGRYEHGEVFVPRMSGCFAWSKNSHEISLCCRDLRRASISCSSFRISSAT